MQLEPWFFTVHVSRVSKFCACRPTVVEMGFSISTPSDNHADLALISSMAFFFYLFLGCSTDRNWLSGFEPVGGKAESPFVSWVWLVIGSRSPRLCKA
jgi:hypothetical protein